MTGASTESSTTLSSPKMAEIEEAGAGPSKVTSQAAPSTASHEPESPAGVSDLPSGLSAMTPAPHDVDMTDPAGQSSAPSFRRQLLTICAILLAINELGIRRQPRSAEAETGAGTPPAWRGLGALWPRPPTRPASEVPRDPPAAGSHFECGGFDWCSPLPGWTDWAAVRRPRNKGAPRTPPAAGSHFECGGFDWCSPEPGWTDWAAVRPPHNNGRPLGQRLAAWAGHAARFFGAVLRLCLLPSGAFGSLALTGNTELHFVDELTF
jgi:hypothetical protein